MNCRIAEGMVTRYMNHTLSVSELEAFLDHVENCSSCYDELETYFIVHKAVQQLDGEDGESALDFREFLEEDIRSSKHYILKKKFGHAVAAMGICSLAAGLGGLIIYGIMQLL